MTDDLIKLLKPYPQPLSQPVPNRIWLHDLGGGDIAWCDDPQPVPGEDMDNVAYIRVDIMNDRIEAQTAEIARLREELARIFAHFDAKNLHHRGNAPGHGHQVPGVWDKDISNGDKGGTPCNWCATWNEARQALQETANDPA